MTRDVYLVLFAQFLTAFADNAILFTAIALVMQNNVTPAWYVPALQASFLVAFVVCAPWVGPYSDSRPKARVLTIGNIVKGIGAALMMAQIEPLFSYAVVGLGAAIYGPAKYGILPELVDEQRLVKANGWIEGATILAILLGTLAGAWLSESSVTLALSAVTALYAVSAIVALWIKRIVPAARPRAAALPQFSAMVRRLLHTPRARFSTLGVSLFWAVSVVLRVLLVAWAPAALMIQQTSKIAELVMFLAFGVAFGALLAARAIPLAFLRRARLAAYAMGVIVLGLALVHDAWTARATLFLIGVAGGLFVVPINAALQEIGHKTIGAGGAVAVQNFFENLAMLIASGLYGVAAGLGVAPIPSLVALAVFTLIATFVVSWHLPPDRSGPLIEK